MSKKEIFINEIEASGIILSEDAAAYFESLKAAKKSSGDGGITEKGQMIVDTMKEHKDERGNLFTAADIADYLGSTPRQVSGAMRKLISLELVSKKEGKPVYYSLEV